jgi:hypothetical protein
VTKRLQRLFDFTICVWLLSWFALYLEIFRYHHVVPSRMFSVLWPTADTAAKPGGFVRSVVACSLLAPLLLMLSILVRSGRRSADLRAAPTAVSSLAAAFAMLGLTMALLGALNQIIRKPPMAFDLTMREGNGGFFVIGAALFAAGAFFRYRATKEQSRLGERGFLPALFTFLRTKRIRFRSAVTAMPLIRQRH